MEAQMDLVLSLLKLHQKMKFIIAKIMQSILI